MPATDTACTCKVGGLIEEFEMTEANDRLVDRWLGVHGDGESVRSLTNWFNQEVLRAAMREAGDDPVDGTVENLYRLLIDEDVLEASAIQARTELAERGLDPDDILDRFISHQSMYRHLTNCLDAKKGTPDLSVEKERDRISSMRNRAEAVVVDSLMRLRDADELAIDDFEVLVPIRFSCEECGAIYDVTELVDQGGCDCQQ